MSDPQDGYAASRESSNQRILYSGFMSLYKIMSMSRRSILAGVVGASDSQGESGRNVVLQCGGWI